MTDDRIARFRKMADQFPTSELPRFSLGQALLEARRWGEAEETFAEVIRINPSYMMAFVHRTRALMELERWSDAADACRTAISLAISQGHSGPRAECEQLLAEIEDELG